MEIAFTKVKLPYGWLGNMSPYPIEYYGSVYRTTEALFQALRFDDHGVREAIRQELSPMGAKMAAKSYRHKMIVAPRGEADVENMRLVLRLKCDQHPALVLRLIDTHEATLIEDCSARVSTSGVFWGMARGNDNKWVGENWLGKLWMELRDSCGP